MAPLLQQRPCRAGRIGQRVAASPHPGIKSRRFTSALVCSSSSAAPSDGPSTSANIAASAGAPVERDMSLEPFKRILEEKKFFCTMCGKCCTGDGEIWVNEDEAKRIASYLNLSLQRFYATYAKQYDRYKGWRLLRFKAGTTNCVFLGEDNKCSIHPVRPSQCSTYPWWPELMVQREWDWEKENVCEGFDHADAVPLSGESLEEAARQLRYANKMTQLRLLSSTQRISKQEADWAEQVIIQDSELDPAGVPKAGDLPMSPKALRPPTPPKQQQANSKFRAPAVLPDQQLGLEDMPDQKL